MMRKLSLTSNSSIFTSLENGVFNYWHQKGIVKRYLTKNNKSKKRFSFIDGPITANNPMGVHHAWGRTYKDLWQRFYNMLGYKQRFQNGFDCQGLWVEVEVEKELGIKNKKEIENLVSGRYEESIAKFVNLCKERVKKYSKIQTEQSRRLGYFMDWDNSYYTMSDENNYMIWHFLKTCHQKGWIYKGRDSVPWCPRCQTAISQHEMLTEDYKEVIHKSIYLELPIIGRTKEYLLVWTTTPWTIPANIAVAVDKKLQYSLVQGNSGDLFWIARDLVEPVFKGEYKGIIKTVKGEQLVGLSYRGPFDSLPAVFKVKKENPNTFHKIIATDEKILPITTLEGTGLVHTAVSAGAEDFKLGKKYGLPMIPVINDSAHYLENLGFLTGKNAKKHPELIFDYLDKREKENKENWIFKLENYKHRYPACWRCKTELVWKVADEWYIAMDIKDKSDKRRRTLRQQMMDVAKKISWMPKFGLERELDWLSNMHDWLISKPNRYWGLALPIYECNECGAFEIIGSKKELKERAVEGWDEFKNHSPHKPWIDRVKIKCSKCKSIVKRLPDVGNVWLDAGVVPFSTITKKNKGGVLYLHNRKEWLKWCPADFITESFPGQFKNWFYSLIAMSTVLEKTNSFKNILGFGTLLGEDGRPMHKSWGNMILFDEGAEKIGADVMRWMYTRQKPEDNLLFGYKVANETRRKFHLPLWNIFQFYKIQIQISKYNPFKSKLDLQSNHILDKWLLARLAELITLVTEKLRQLNAFSASAYLETFVEDLSVWYIRRSRERDDKKQLLDTLCFVLVNLMRLLAPFIPFLSEEIYRNITKRVSVHLESWPKMKRERRHSEILNRMQSARIICEIGHRLRKEKMIRVRQPLSKIQVLNSQTTLDSFFGELIKDELNVKKVEWLKGKGELEIKLDTKITADLRSEGQARDFIRQIQQLRKNNNCTLTEKINIYAPSWPQEFEDYIKSRTLAETILQGKELKVVKIG